MFWFLVFYNFPYLPLPDRQCWIMTGVFSLIKTSHGSCPTAAHWAPGTGCSPKLVENQNRNFKSQIYDLSICALRVQSNEANVTVLNMHVSDTNRLVTVSGSYPHSGQTKAMQ